MPLTQMTLSMIGSCIASRVSGPVVPLNLKHLGLDPATASSLWRRPRLS